ncbi:Abc1 family protein [Thalictrum thalictroides]|uniref:Abc1 family protein n=1 Tax=Thalictrum thalictroides TaxID=46969 RepID=A0A7J6XDV7_THATH|nr:Abc1 family protein [Thalictrum thalictroides]
MTTKLRKFFKIPASAKKKTLYLITATGITGLTFESVAAASSTNPNFAPLSNDIGEKVRFGFDGIFRSSRAIYTISSNVVDYKYSLRGLELDSNEFYTKLSEVHLRSAKRLLKLCETNKGFYVKAGQFVAAMRQVPTEYSSTLASLQDKAVPYHFKAVKEVLVRNLGQDLSDLFLSFDEKPIAAASIAQVHRAMLKDHQEVAIKVQYPGLEKQMKIDITTMAFLSNATAWIFPEYRFEWMVSEFERSISRELDFIQEAKNSERTAKNFRKNNIVRVPRVNWELTTNQVLTMQFCSGHKIDDVGYLKEAGINPTKVAKALMEVFAEMVFVHGFVHGDPHPGNILVAPEGRNGFSLVLLDHGIYKELDEGFRLDYCQMWNALILLDSKKIQFLGERFGVGKYSRYFPVIFTGRTIDSKSALGRGMSDEEKKNLKLEVKSLKMEDFSAFMESLPSDFLTILRTDGLLKSITSKLGAPQQVRLLAYAKYSIYGLSAKSNAESDSTVGHVLYRFKTAVTYVRFRLFLESVELFSEMKDLQQFVAKKLKQMLFAAVHLLIIPFSLIRS